MINQSLIIIASAFGAVVNWFEDVVSSLGAGTLIIVALVTVFGIGVVLEPLRGSMQMNMVHYTKNSTYKNKNKKGNKGG